MKRNYLLTLLMATVITTSLFAQSGYHMVIEKNNGLKKVFSSNEIKSIYFYKNPSNNSDDILLLPFSGFYSDTVEKNERGDGSVVFNFPNAWSWIGQMLYQDLSEYSDVVVELNEPLTFNMKVIALYSDGENATYAQVGEKTIFHPLDPQKKNYVTQIALQNLEVGTVNIKRIYLLKKGEGTPSPVDAIDVVGTWNVVSGSYKRYENDVLISEESGNATPPYDRIAFYDNGTMEYLEYRSSRGTWHEDGKGNYVMDGTALVYTGGDWDYFEITAVNNANEMEVVFQFSEDKGSTVVKKVYRSKLQRTTESTPRDDEDSDDGLLSGNDSNFEDGSLGNWWFWGGGQARVASPGYQSDYCAALTSNNAGSQENLNGQIIYTLPSYLEVGKTYRIQFDARSAKYNHDIAFRCQNSSIYDHQLIRTFNIGLEWKHYQYDFTIPNDYWDINQLVFDYPYEVATSYLDNIQLSTVEGGGDTPSPVDAIDVVGTWNIVSGSYKRYENGVLISEESENLTAPYDRIAFYDNGTMEYLEYSSSRGTWHEDGKGNYVMDGTALEYTGGDWDYFEITAVNNANEMEVVFKFSEDKGSTVVEKVYRSKLQRTTESTPRDDEGGGDTPTIPFVGQWNVVKYVDKEYHGSDLYSQNESSGNEYRIDFTENTVTWMSERYPFDDTVWKEERSGTYHMDGTMLVFDSGEFDYFEVTSFDGQDNMQVVFQYSRYKSGTTVRYVKQMDLQRKKTL